MADIPESARLFVSGLIERARRIKETIVFPEMGGAMVIGSSLQASAKAANGVSRGCTAEATFDVAVVTAVQSERE